MEDSNIEIKSGELNPIKANRIIPISIKLKSIEFLEINGNHNTAISYDVDRRLLYIGGKKKKII